MPVEGLPDPDKHWACMRCGQWFEAEEGKVFEVGRATVSGMVADSIRGGGKLRFRCDPCTARRHRNRIWFYAALAVLVAAGFAAQALELI